MKICTDENCKIYTKILNMIISGQEDSGSSNFLLIIKIFLKHQYGKRVHFPLLKNYVNISPSMKKKNSYCS